MPLAEVAGRKLYYEFHEARDADASQPPLVLVTGIGGRCAGWNLFQVPALTSSRRVLIYDHRGVGDSDDPDLPFTTADLGADLMGLLDALSLDRVDAMGFFMGAMAIQEAALAHPDRFRRLVFVGSWARVGPRRAMLLREWASLARQGVPASSMVRQRLIWTFSGAALSETELIDAAVAEIDDGATPLTGEGFARQCDACANHDALDRLAALDHPTLVLCGRKDLLTPPRFGREIAAVMPNARDIALSYGAHAVMLERAKRVNEIVDHFLAEPEADALSPHLT